jgi:hypothetical protein
VKRISLLLLPAIAVAALAVLLFASPGQSGPRNTGQNEARVYTFEQAVAAGIVPSLQDQLAESGLLLCPPNSAGTGGYSSGEALKAAEAKAPEAPTCMADPRQATFSVGGPAQPGVPSLYRP